MINLQEIQERVDLVLEIFIKSVRYGSWDHMKELPGVVS